MTGYMGCDSEMVQKGPTASLVLKLAGGSPNLCQLAWQDGGTMRLVVTATSRQPLTNSPKEQSDVVLVWYVWSHGLLLPLYGPDFWSECPYKTRWRMSQRHGPSPHGKYSKLYVHYYKSFLFLILLTPYCDIFPHLQETAEQ